MSNFWQVVPWVPDYLFSQPFQVRGADVNINDFPGGSPERIPERSPKIKSPHFSSEQSLKGPTGETENVRLTEHKRDPEVLQLVQKLSQSPEIRLDRIEEVRQQLASGEFLSRQSAEATAEALLR